MYVDVVYASVCECIVQRFVQSLYCYVYCSTKWYWHKYWSVARKCNAPPSSTNYLVLDHVCS